MDFMGWGGDLRKIPNFFSITNISTTNYKEREDGSHIQSQSIFDNVELAWKSMLYLTVTGRNDWESALAFSKYKSFFYPRSDFRPSFPRWSICRNGSPSSRCVVPIRP